MMTVNTWIFKPTAAPGHISSIIVDGFVGEEPTQLRVGIGWRNGTRVFGLFHAGYMTHMCYGLDYFDAVDVLTMALNDERSPDSFFFDAGTTRRSIRVPYVNIEKAFFELGMLSGTDWWVGDFQAKRDQHRAGGAAE